MLIPKIYIILSRLSTQCHVEQANLPAEALSTVMMAWSKPCATITISWQLELQYRASDSATDGTWI